MERIDPRLIGLGTQLWGSMREDRFCSKVAEEEEVKEGRDKEGEEEDVGVILEKFPTMLAIIPSLPELPQYQVRCHHLLAHPAQPKHLIPAPTYKVLLRDIPVPSTMSFLLTNEYHLGK